MKHICLLLALIILLSCTGCCYAPGHRGQLQLENLFSNVPTLPAEEYTPISKETVPADNPNDPVSQGPVPIADPKVDLSALPERRDDEFVDVLDYIPDLVVDLQYGTVNNFTGKAIYKTNEVYLRYGTVKKLMEVQKELRAKGYLLKLWDGFRTVSAQKALWYSNPDPNYVANPDTGGSSHSKGNTVDVTVVDASGNELVMPTGFDDFTVLADRDYSDCSPVAAENATMLQELMEKHGFVPYDAEWWHFRDTTDYPVEELLDPNAMGTYYAKCNEYISLREKPDTSANVITTISANAQFKLLGFVDEFFAWVEFEGQRGYVLIAYTGKVN